MRTAGQSNNRITNIRSSSFGQSASSQPVNQTLDHSSRRSVRNVHSVNQAVNLPTDRPTDRPTDQSINQSIDRSTDQANEQPTNRTIDRRITQTNAHPATRRCPAPTCLRIASRWVQGSRKNSALDRVAVGIEHVHLACTHPPTPPTYASQAGGCRALAKPQRLTGLPSASSTCTSPSLSARTGASIFFRSPTITQVIASGLMICAMAFCAAGWSIASRRGLSVCT